MACHSDKKRSNISHCRIWHQTQKPNLHSPCAYVSEGDKFSLDMGYICSSCCFSHKKSVLIKKCQNVPTGIPNFFDI